MEELAPNIGSINEAGSISEERGECSALPSQPLSSIRCTLPTYHHSKATVEVDVELYGPNQAAIRRLA